MRQVQGGVRDGAPGLESKGVISGGRLLRVRGKVTFDLK